MDTLSMVAGLDYHQHSIQLCVMDQQARVRLNRACANDLDTLIATLQSAGPVRAIALEACCGAADLAEQLARKGSWQVHLAHAGYVAKLKGSPDKSDYSDARLLADLTRVGYLPRVWLAPQSIRDLRQLVYHRQRQVNQRRDLKLRIGACLREQRIKLLAEADNKGYGTGRWSKRWVEAVKNHPGITPSVKWVVDEMFAQIAYLEESIARTDERLETAAQAQPLYSHLKAIEGIGSVTAWWLLAAIGRFDRFNNGKQLARYCGLSPRNASSGQKQSDAGLIEQCNQGLRTVLIQAAQRLARHDARWQKLAVNLKARGKPASVVIAAIANRWVRSLHHRVVKAERELAQAAAPARTPAVENGGTTMAA